jgi:uncharacterized membrane protein
LKPFSIHETLLARHAQHVVLIHFPIALFLTGVAFDFTAQWTKRGTLAAAAYFNFLVAALSTPLVLITGVLAWQLQLEGQKLEGILLQHLVLGVASSAMICLVWYIHFRSRCQFKQVLPSYCLPLEVLAVAVVAVTGHLGGFLSGVNGQG